MNINIKHTSGNVGNIYGHNNIIEWIQEIDKCNKENKLTKSQFLPQEVYIHNIERVFANNHRIFICGNRTDEYDNVMKWLDSLSEEELNLFDLYAIEADEEKHELHLYFKVY